MSQCKNFIGKKKVISELERIAYDGDPERPTEIYNLILDVGKDWGENYKPGQFIILRVNESGERIPLTITDYNPLEGSLKLVFQVAGATTRKLTKLKKGDTIEDLTPPLGQPLNIEEYKPGNPKTAIVVAGGVGIAPAYAKAKALSEAGYEVISLLGARSENILFMVDEMRKVSNRVIITTDDGSYDGGDAAYIGDGSNGAEDRKLFGVQVLDEMIDYKGKGKDKKMPEFHNQLKASEVKEIFIVGPPIMMKFVAKATEKMGVKTYASMNSTMIDGSGMCGGCKLTLHKDEEVIAYTCRDGPTFDAHEIDWAEVLKRGAQYIPQEQLSNVLLDSEVPVESLTVEDLTEMSDNDYLQKVAEYLELPKTATIKELMGGMQNKFKHKAGYLSLEQAVSVDAMNCVCKPKPDKKSKCQELCPVNVDVQGFINYMKKKTIEEELQEVMDDLGVKDTFESILAKVEKNPEQLDSKIIEVIDNQMYEAFKVIKNSDPIPEMTGLVCPQESQCQSTCIKGKKEEPTNIGRLEAFVSYWVRVNKERIVGYDWYEKESVAKPTGKKVMIIGSGPGGLVAAAELAKKGHDVTVYETLHEPGGVLIYGIPEFRLPKAIVRYEVEQIAELGVKFELNHPIRDVEEHMKKNGFDAAFVATGAGTPWFLEIPGENLTGVYSANEFLTRVNLMKAYKFPVYDTPVPNVIGKKVVVFGGGNVAMDSARSALRLGASEVTIMYRRSEKEIPARHEEFLAAQEEGIKFNYLTTPFELDGEEGAFAGVKYYDNELGEPDASGRRRPIPIKDKPKYVEADIAVVAIGQGPNKIMDVSAFERDRNDRIIVNGETLATNVDKVYAGGDIIAGNEGTVIYAAGCGLKAANAIDEALKKSP